MTLIGMTLLAAALSLAAPALAADAMSKDQYKAEKDRIEAEAKAGREKCKNMSGNAKDVCMAEAKGSQKLAKAELDARQKDSAKARYNVTVAKAGMEYDVAKEKCDDRTGKDKSACVKEARAAHDQAKKQARAEREAAEGKKERTADASRKMKETK